jgi:hypothetical protein
LPLVKWLLISLSMERNNFIMLKEID